MRVRRRFVLLGSLIAGAALLLAVALPALGWAVQQTAAPAPNGLSFAIEDNTPLARAGIFPSDLVGMDGLQAIPCVNLGLLCIDQLSGIKDQIHGLSYGNDFQRSHLPPVEFSVGVRSQGAAGTAVRVEASCATPEPQADVFASNGDATNVQVFDGNGQACGSNAGLGLGLAEGASSDQLRDFDEYPCPVVDASCDGMPEQPVFYSLAAGSPSLSLVRAAPADILLSAGGITPVVWAWGTADLGLAPGDVINALCIQENGNGIYDPGDRVMFTLAPGSPTLAARGFSAADVLMPGSPPGIFFRAASLGLQPGDSITGMSCAFEVSQIYLPAISR